MFRDILLNWLLSSWTQRLLSPVSNRTIRLVAVRTINFCLIFMDMRFLHKTWLVCALQQRMISVPWSWSRFACFVPPCRKCSLLRWWWSNNQVLILRNDSRNLALIIPFYIIIALSHLGVVPNRIRSWRLSPCCQHFLPWKWPLHSKITRCFLNKVNSVATKKQFLLNILVGKELLVG